MCCVQAATKSRPVAPAVITPQRVSTRDHEKDKPFACKCKPWKCNSKSVVSIPHTFSCSSSTCPGCRRRYKTASSLKAHHTQNHPGEPFPPSLEEKVPVILPPPPNLQGKELAKPNPYCDFCLGDSTGNKKTSKPEKMVSCADCGRSGRWEGER